jgi:hypothetical protein
MKVGLFDLSVAEFLEGPYISVQKDIYVPHGKERVIKVGSIPCRYIQIKLAKGVPLLDYSKY